MPTTVINGAAFFFRARLFDRTRRICWSNHVHAGMQACMHAGRDTDRWQAGGGMDGGREEREERERVMRLFFSRESSIFDSMVPPPADARRAALECE
jgi:hypothetical protein